MQGQKALEFHQKYLKGVKNCLSFFILYCFLRSVYNVIKIFTSKAIFCLALTPHQTLCLNRCGGL